MLQKLARRFSGGSKRPKFDFSDPFNLESRLTGPEKKARDIANEFAQSQAPSLTADNRSGTLNRKFYKNAGSLGLIAPTLKGYGTVETSTVGLGLICRELEKVDSAYRSALGIQSALVIKAIDGYGSEAQKLKFLTPLVRGELIGCSALTERLAGSDPMGSMTSTAKLENGFWTLNGSKHWIENSPLADLLLVYAKDVDTGDLRGFLIERDLITDQES
jgi:glutaryl-CoA dehydrogenase